MNNGEDDQGHEIDLADARDRLLEAERLVAMLEARLIQYQRALENIRSTSGKVLDC